MALVVNTIPASQLVNAIPSVLPAGGGALNLSGMFLTTNPRVPLNSALALSFISAEAVGAYFGYSSNEYQEALVYFNGYTGATAIAGAMWFTQYPIASVAAYIRGGVVSALTLAQLQAISGTLAISINATPHSGSVNLSAATSFSNAARIIATDLSLPVLTTASFTGSVTSDVLTVTVLASGTIAPGQTLVGTSLTTDVSIVLQLTGTPGDVGTYTTTTTTNAASEAMTTTTPAVSYDSVSGAFVITSSTTGAASAIAYATTGAVATSLALTQATGAILSQGAIAATPDAFMTALTGYVQNWATFTTLSDPDGGSGNTQKLLFAAWTNGQNNRYAYIPFDNDIVATEQGSSEPLGVQLATANYSGTAPIYEPSTLYGPAFIMGIAAAINFNTPQGATAFAARSQTGLVPGVTNGQIAANLIANGYNFYGAYATANYPFNELQPGLISGPFAWLDAYIEQIWLNAGLQLSLVQLRENVGTIPYNAYGNALIESAFVGSPQNPGPVDAAVSFGMIQPGVTLSSSQATEVNNMAGGLNIVPTLQTRGWYLYIGTASPTVRAARGSPPIIFFYTQGGNVQTINVASVEVA